MWLQLKGEETEYSYDILSTLETITIDNENLGGSYKKQNEGNRTIKLISSLGYIFINFKKN